MISPKGIIRVHSVSDNSLITAPRAEPLRTFGAARWARGGGFGGGGFGGGGGAPDAKGAARDAAMGAAWHRVEAAAHATGVAIAAEGNAPEVAGALFGKAVAETAAAGNEAAPAALEEVEKQARGNNPADIFNGSKPSL